MAHPLQGPALRLKRIVAAAAAPSSYTGLSQISVARRLPFSRQTLSDIEQGLLGIAGKTSREIDDAITAGTADIPTPSKNGKR